ncbi:hypothetical protein LS684_02670 [Cytobacillus spongiae]|uniref:hypothetical protein n=1 Tax=Cytobacillus spongiae TaxID=2901381 RepID=UPI001F4761DE|nr:hypothetical protein [Cytobacillus spongiae]UII56408.1 hypothetical protein LS684_02670 [Cytobacillus spongiae]
MGKVKAVKIDGEAIHFFKSQIYVYQSTTGYTLELDMIVSEVAVQKYRREETWIVEVELEDGRVISSYMHLKSLSGGLPQLNLFCQLAHAEEYGELPVFTETDVIFPDFEQGITLDEIRQFEMPYEKIGLKISLPIDQVEWLKQRKNRELSDMLKEAIYDYWKKHDGDGI